MMLDYFWYFGD